MIKQSFPAAGVVALPSVVRDIVFTTDDKMHMWAEVFGRNVPSEAVFPMPLPSGAFKGEAAR